MWKTEIGRDAWDVSGCTGWELEVLAVLFRQITCRNMTGILGEMGPGKNKMSFLCFVISSAGCLFSSHNCIRSTQRVGSRLGWRVQFHHVQNLHGHALYALVFSIVIQGRDFWFKSQAHACIMHYIALLRYLDYNSDKSNQNCGNEPFYPEICKWKDDNHSVPLLNDSCLWISIFCWE